MQSIQIDLMDLLTCRYVKNAAVLKRHVYSWRYIHGRKNHQRQSNPAQVPGLRGTLIKGGGNGRKELMLNCTVQKDELKRCLERAELWAEIVDKGLSVLGFDDRLVPRPSDGDSRHDQKHLPLQRYRRYGILHFCTASLLLIPIKKPPGNIPGGWFILKFLPLWVLYPPSTQ